MSKKGNLRGSVIKRRKSSSLGSVRNRIIECIERAARKKTKDLVCRRKKKEEEETGHVFLWLSGEIRDRKHLGGSRIVCRVLYSIEPPHSIRSFARLRGDLSKTNATSNIHDAIPSTSRRVVYLPSRQSWVKPSFVLRSPIPFASPRIGRIFVKTVP